MVGGPVGAQAKFGLNGAQVRFELPQQVQFAGTASTTVTLRGGEVVLTLGHLDAGAVQSVEVPVKVASSCRARQVLLAVARLNSSTALPVESNPVVTLGHRLGRRRMPDISNIDQLVALLASLVRTYNGSLFTSTHLRDNPNVCHASCEWFLHNAPILGGREAISELDQMDKNTLVIAQQHAGQAAKAIVTTLRMHADKVMVYMAGRGPGHVMCIVRQVGAVLMYDPNLGVMVLPLRDTDELNRGSAENRAAQGFDKGRRSGLGKCGHHSHNHQNRVRPQAHKLGRLIGLHTAIDAPL